MQNGDPNQELRGLYESLARFAWLQRRLAGARPGSRLEMHKALAAPAPGSAGPGAGVAGLHEWLLELLQPLADGAVLDIGCGFGATVLAWARHRPGRHVGLSSSPFQVRKARQQAQRLGLAERCEFRLQSYDDPIEGHFCAAVAVEALMHAADLRHTLHRVAACLEPGGQLVLLEDMARDDSADGDADVGALLRSWSTPRLHSVADYRGALADAGLAVVREIDLTGQVRPRPIEKLTAAERKLKRVRRLAPLPGARRLCDAFLGGIALERLYARRAVCYRAMLATHGPEGK